MEYYNKNKINNLNVIFTLFYILLIQQSTAIEGGTIEQNTLITNKVPPAQTAKKKISSKAKKSPEIIELFHEAEAAYQIGNLDDSFNKYKKILLLDPKNIAAHLRIKLIDQKKEETTSFLANEEKMEMINKTEQEWVSPITKNDHLTSNVIEEFPISNQSREIISDKLSNLIISNINFYELPISEAIDQIKKKAVLLDTSEEDPNKKGVNIVLQLHSLNTKEEPKITLSLTDLPLKEVLSYIANQANLILKIEPYAVVLIPQQDYQEQLVIKEYKIPSTIIELLSSSKNTTNNQEDLSFKNREELNPKDFFLSQGVSFPKGAMAYYIPSSNIFVIKNTQSNLDLVDSIIKSSLENRTSQIEIEARFLEVKQSNLNEEGLNWLLGSFELPFGSGITSAAAGSSQAAPQSSISPLQLKGASAGDSAGSPAGNPSIFSGGTTINANALDTAALVTPYAPATGVLALAGILTNPQFQVILKALNQQQGVNLLSAPKITVSSGHRATINISREFPYPADYIPPQIPQYQGGGVNPAIPATPSSFKKRDVGVQLEVEPRVRPNDASIELSLSPEIVEFQGFVNYGTPIYSQAPVFFAGQTNTILSTQQVLLTQNTINQPIFSVRQVTTEVTLHDGQTVVLGGLMREDIQKINNKVPLLGSIPLFGSLFRSSSEQKIKQNLLIFVTVHFINNINEKNKQI